MVKSLAWTRPTHQTRSAATLERLLDAAEALLCDKGFADLPIAEIARKAGYSVGAVYARFRDKESLLRCLEERFVDEVRATADAVLQPDRWEGATLGEVVSEIVAFMVRIHRERLGILREMLGRAHVDAITGQRSEWAIRHVCDRLSDLLAGFRDEIGHPDPAAAVPFAFRLILGVLKEAILFRGPGAHGIPESDAALSVEMSRAFLGYLSLPGP